MPSPPESLPGRIFKIRGMRVILDTDLAQLYGVTTSRLNEAAKRNSARFPPDFRFLLTNEELSILISQNAISSSRHGGARKPPWVFNEHGALMASNVLRSSRATEMAIYIVRAFVKQREAIASDVAILKRLTEVDRTLLEHDSALQILWKRLQPLLTPPPEPSRRKIGFHPT